MNIFNVCRYLLLASFFLKVFTFFINIIVHVMMGKNSTEKEEIVKDKVLGYHDLPLWTQHGVISETSHTKSLLVRLKCPYCQNNVPISVTPNIGTISVSVECACCNNQIKSTIESSFETEKRCKVF